MDNEESNQEKKKNALVLWLKRIGIIGFLFFLCKGLLWLALPTLIVWFGTH